MITEIIGVQFDNKGAQLMLCACTEQIIKWDKRNIVAIRPRMASFRERALIGLHQIVFTDTNIPILSPAFNRLVKFIPARIKERYGLVTYSQVDSILDASGFSYSDQWGPGQSINMAKFSKRCKREGKKVILLPQAFGPFEDPDVRSAFVEVIENSDLIFARDEVSYNYLIKLGTKNSHIRLAPDFTNLVRGKIPDYFIGKENRACIIPNIRMTDKTSAEVKESYFFFLKQCIASLFDKGLDPFILVHDLTDYELAEQLKEPVEIIREDDPLYIKGILGTCHSVVSSRFHGLINALSQDVPCVASGWSHKYQMLLKDYDCPECLIKNISSAEEISQKIDIITDEPSRSQLLDRLRPANLTQKRLAEEMWNEVRSLLEE